MLVFSICCFRFLGSKSTGFFLDFISVFSVCLFIRLVGLLFFTKLLGLLVCNEWLGFVAGFVLKIDWFCWDESFLSFPC